MDVEFVDFGSPEFPKFVFCIPEEMTNLIDDYEGHLKLVSLNEFLPISISNETVTPRFTPFIIDAGSVDGSGFDSYLALCYKIRKPRSFFAFVSDFANSSLSFFNDSSPFLDVFFSFSNETNDHFLLEEAKITTMTKADVTMAKKKDS